LDNTRVRILFILLRKAQFFFQEFNIRLYDKNSESDKKKFQQHWESEYFFRKKTITRSLSGCPRAAKLKRMIGKMVIGKKKNHYGKFISQIDCQ
jgi:hypothetical protein